MQMRIYRRRTRRKRQKPVEWIKDATIHERVVRLVVDLEIDWVLPEFVYTFRSYNSSSNAIARIWGLNKVWQMAISHDPAYVLEVISERFDRLNERQKDEVILHELAHIPRNFSGALMAHSHAKGAFHDKLDKFIKDYRRR